MHKFFHKICLSLLTVFHFLSKIRAIYSGNFRGITIKGDIKILKYGGQGQTTREKGEVTWKLKVITLFSGEKFPDHGHLWVNFSFKMQFYYYLDEKNSKLFPMGLLFICCCWLLLRCLSKWPYPKKSPLPWKTPEIFGFWTR